MRKKILSKILAYSLAASLAWTLLPVNLLAAESSKDMTKQEQTSKETGADKVTAETQIVVDEVEIEQKDQEQEIKVPVRIKNNVGICGFALEVILPEGYKLTSITRGDTTTSGSFSENISETGNYCTWYSDANMTEEGTIFTLNIVAGKEVKGGDIVVKLKDDKKNNLSDENGMTVSAEFVSGKVNVKHVHVIVVDKAVEATCTKEGLTEGSHCSVCNEVIKAQEVVPKKDHEVVVDKAVEATCTKEGLTEGSHCSVCNEVIKAQEVVPKKDHEVVVDKAVEPTCTEKGLTEGSHCSVCDEVIKAQEEVAPLGHDYDEGKVTKEPTETEKGEKTYTCKRCGDTYTEAIDTLEPHEHKIVIDKAVEPTCTEKGLTEGSHCSICNKVLKAQEEVPAKGHDYEEKVTKEATCTEEGEKTYTCKNCGDKYTEVIKAKGHDYEEKVTKEATCTEEGEKTYTCKNCGDKYTEVIKAKGHDYEEKVTKEPTCTEEGEKTYTCKNCKDEYTEVIEKIKHDYEEKVTKEPTETEVGIKTYTCKMCGDTYTEEIPVKEVTNQKAKDFVKKYATSMYDVIYAKASVNNYVQILKGISTWNSFTATEQEQVNQLLSSRGKVTYKKLYDEAEKIRKQRISDDGGNLASIPMTATGKSTSTQLTWSKVKGADGYYIYAARCNTSSKKYSWKCVKTIKSGSTVTYTHKSLLKNTSYKYRIGAYTVIDGKEVLIARSLILHSYTTGSSPKYKNPSKVTVSNSNVSLKVGKTKKVTAKVSSYTKGKKTSNHVVKIRYIISNPEIASITLDGTIKAKKAGSCTIWACAQNGVRKAIKVTVTK